MAFAVGCKLPAAPVLLLLAAVPAGLLKVCAPPPLLLLAWLLLLLLSLLHSRCINSPAASKLQAPAAPISM